MFSKFLALILRAGLALIKKLSMGRAGTRPDHATLKKDVSFKVCQLEARLGRFKFFFLDIQYPSISRGPKHEHHIPGWILPGQCMLFFCSLLGRNSSSVSVMLRLHFLSFHFS